MNWDAIGAVGEIVGALAVVATLLYLAKQVSDAKGAVRRQASQNVNEMFNSIHHVVASSSELAAIDAKAESGQDLLPHESVQFRSLALANFNPFENMYMQAKDIDDLIAIDEVGKMFSAARDAFPKMWEENSHFAGSDFREFVDRFDKEQAHKAGSTR